MRLLRGLFETLVRLAILPFKLAYALMGATFRTGVKVGAAPARLSVRATRAAGVSGVICFFLGLAAGLFFAPGPGRDLRQKVRRLVSGQVGLSDDELADRVSFELGHAPRTWHLPQPNVVVSGGRVQLSGTVPHDTARDELVRVAAAIPGVAGVDDLLDVDETAGAQ